MRHISALPLGALVFLAATTAFGAGDWDCRKAPSGQWSCVTAGHERPPEPAATEEPEVAPKSAATPAPGTRTQAEVVAEPGTATEPDTNPGPEAIPEPETTPAPEATPAPKTPLEHATLAEPEAPSGQETGKAPQGTTAVAPPPIDTSRLYQGLDWAWCGPPPRGVSAPQFTPAAPHTPLTLTADAAEIAPRARRLTLSGHVLADRGPRHLEAERLDYARKDQEILASGNVYFRQPGLRLVAGKARWDLAGHQGWLERVRYRLEGENARGEAASAHLETAAKLHFQDITFTTCPPGQADWEIAAERLDVDRRQGIAIAHGARLRLGGVPVLYSPYLPFSLDDRRKSGFLAPILGSSKRRGFEFATPYYFNLAPNRDATLTPRYMSKRGIMLGTEYRYLTPSERGTFYGEIVPNDPDFERNAVRGGLNLRQDGLFADRWGTQVRFNLVSDDTYLEDFGAELGTTSARNLERRADLTYQGGGWYVLGRLQGFQTLDPTIARSDRPYSRLPQILFHLDRELPAGLQLRLDAENVWFDHPHRVYGDRLALEPRLSWPLRRPWGHLIPEARLYYRSYWLQDPGPGQPDRPDLFAPSLNLDAGLTFERNTQWFGHGALQTLEPRIYYLYTPYRKQSDLPVFDSAELDFTFASLFLADRFTGRDRLGDANRLSLGLTSRTLDDRDGGELLRLSLGQIFYFQDRRVQITGGADTADTSTLVAGAAARLRPGLEARASGLWDPARGHEQIRRSAFGLHYAGGHGLLANAAYRLNRSSDPDNAYEDTDVSFYWPVNPQWRLVGRWLYSLRHEQSMETVAGVEYGRCCWRLRALARSLTLRPDSDPELSLLVQVELSGLGRFGNRIDEVLERTVYGYHQE